MTEKKSGLSCGEALVQLLADYGIDTVFGIPGVHTLELYRGLDSNKVKHYLVRHEQGAGFMADGYARVSGKPAACFLITGPGVINAGTPIGQAFSDSVPMLVISSVNAVEDLGQGRGRLHEVTDQRAVIAPLVAFSATAYSIDQIPALVARAFAVFRSQRPRPVHIEIPLDVLDQRVPEPWKIQAIPGKPAADKESLAAATALLKGAKQPLILAGGGAIDSGPEIKALAARLGAPVIVTTTAKGLVPHDDPWHLADTLGTAAARQALAAADVLLTLGSEMSETDHWTGKLSFSAKMIRVDLDPRKLADDYPATVAMLADAKTTAAALLELLGKGTPTTTWGDLPKKLQAEARQPKHPLQALHMKVLSAIRRAVPDEAIFATDMTQIAYSCYSQFPAKMARGYLHPVGFGTLGYALPAAIGAKIARPDLPVVAIAGDAGFLFTLQELGVAVENGLPLAIVLWNNDWLQQIREGLVERGIPEIGVKGLNPDFLMLARAFGCKAERAETLAEVERLVAAAVKGPGVTLIEVRQDMKELQA